MSYYEVAVNFPKIDSVLTYRSNQTLHVGDLVKVPLGRRQEKGCIIGLGDGEKDSGEFKIKDIVSSIELLKINLELLSFLKQVSEYYHYSLGKLIFDVLPPLLKRPRSLEPIEGRGEELDFKYNSTQEEIIESIYSSRGVYSPHLVYGVTGSGKTIIYLELIRKLIKEGKSVLFLLPEINLKSQFLNFFKKHINGFIYVYNSSLTGSSKFGLWKVLQEGDKAVLVVGTRSSIFLPFSNLGLIIVDEEHDASFKQEDRCPYHARSIAMMRARYLNIPIVLGSATPSTEMLKLFEGQEAGYHRIKFRVSNAALPQICLIDIRNEKQEHWPLSPRSLTEITKALERDEQVLIFINRLGYASYLQCRACGYQFFCQNCSIPLKYFMAKEQVICQYCGQSDHVPLSCPKCDNVKLLQKGYGTEKVQQVLQNIFPDRVVRRFDRDELVGAKQVEETLDKFHQKEIDILVGTQMISKGHNFKRVNLVLILGTDAQLSYPDFRSQEKIFQQVSQVSGRAGRFSQSGRVIIQTCMPKAKVYQYIADSNNDQFYREELSLRREFGYPPYVRMAIIYITSPFCERCEEEAYRLSQVLKEIGKQHFSSVEICGPRVCNTEKRVNQFSRMIFAKSPFFNDLHNLLRSIDLNFSPRSSTSLRIDRDPINIL